MARGKSRVFTDISGLSPEAVELGNGETQKLVDPVVAACAWYACVKRGRSLLKLKLKSS